MSAIDRFSTFEDFVAALPSYPLEQLKQAEIFTREALKITQTHIDQSHREQGVRRELEALRQEIARRVAAS